MGLLEVVGMVQQVHCSRRRLPQRGLEFHVCTINKSAHTKKVWKLIQWSSYMRMFQLEVVWCCVMKHFLYSTHYLMSILIFLFLFSIMLYDCLVFWDGRFSLFHTLFDEHFFVSLWHNTLRFSDILKWRICNL